MSNVNASWVNGLITDRDHWKVKYEKAIRELQGFDKENTALIEEKEDLVKGRRLDLEERELTIRELRNTVADQVSQNVKLSQHIEQLKIGKLSRSAL